jgi:hypothetical protein
MEHHSLYDLAAPTIYTAGLTADEVSAQILETMAR